MKEATTGAKAAIQIETETTVRATTAEATSAPKAAKQGLERPSKTDLPSRSIVRRYRNPSPYMR